MLLDRNRILQHLERISVNGQFSEVVLSGAFKCQAMSPGDQQLLVLADELKSVPPLAQEVGITDLSVLIKVIKSLAQETTEVAIGFEETRIAVDTKHGTKFRIVAMSPNAVPTKVDDAYRTAIEGFLPSATWVPLPEVGVKEIVSSYGLLKSSEVQLNVSQVIEVQIGQDVEHYAVHRLGELKTPPEQPYTLKLNARIFTDVLRLVSDFTIAQLALVDIGSGNRFVAIREGSYTYVISPMS